VPGADPLRLYAALPTPLQHLAIAAYGVQMRRVRTRGCFGATRRALARSERLPASELAALQSDRLRRLAEHAVSRSRYWRETFERLGLSPDRLRGGDDLRRLPILDKKTLLDRTADLRAEGVPAVRTYYTSGTSGTTLAVPIDDASRQCNYAFFARALSWAGVEGARSVTFAGRTVVPSSVTRPRCVWRWNPAMDNRIFSSYHISPDNVEAYSRALCAYRPDYIDSYPSAVSSLAGLLREAGLPAPRLRSVVTSSETLLDAQRELVAEVFGARCFDQYGCTEQSVYVSQCEEGTYHVHPEYGIVEVLDAEGEPVAPGETGEIVCTSFTNDALPLLRYRMGDMATLGEPGCACGRAFPVLIRIEGRVDDVLVTPDGRRVGRLDPVFKGRRTIAEAQIVQTSTETVIVRLVPTREYTDEDGQSVVRELEARLGPEMTIRIEPVEAIERGPSGKFRAVVNRVAASGRADVPADKD
jgi:phenylacetate-CoA ligase